MALRCGFYNSLNGDRKYNAIDVSSIFDGIIADGIYETIGDHFIVKATSGMNITVGTGRAWFNHTWTYNDALLPLSVDASAAILNRIDTVVLEVNNTENIRTNTIKIVKGEEEISPSAPELINTNDVHQYPLADIYVAADVSRITQSNITNRVGTNTTPFVIGVIESMDIDDLIAQWASQWDDWMTATETDFTTWSTSQKTAFVEWLSETKGDFDTWFDNIQYILDGDVAGHLQNEIDANTRKINSLESQMNSQTKHMYMSIAQYGTIDPSQYPNTEFSLWE